MTENNDKANDDGRKTAAAPEERIPDELVRGAGAHDATERENGRKRLRAYLATQGTRDPRREAERIGILASLGKLGRAHRVGSKALATGRKRERRE